MPPRTTRIFVARIPPSVSEAQFKGYFEGFGKLQDAYMPRDHAKQVRDSRASLCALLPFAGPACVPCFLERG